MNNMMDGSWVSVAFALVTIITSGIWLPKKLVPQVIRTPSAIELSHRGDLPVESEMQSRGTQTQYR